MYNGGAMRELVPPLFFLEVGMGASAIKRHQRRLISAVTGCDRALANIDVLRDAFEPDHPEYVELLIASSKMLMMARVSLQDFFLYAWGRPCPRE